MLEITFTRHRAAHFYPQTRRKGACVVGNWFIRWMSLSCRPRAHVERRGQVCGLHKQTLRRRVTHVAAGSPMTVVSGGYEIAALAGDDQIVKFAQPGH